MLNFFIPVDLTWYILDVRIPEYLSVSAVGFALIPEALNLRYVGFVCFLQISV
jgi:hypothetical protein